MIRFVALLLLSLSLGPRLEASQPARLLCLGTYPGFMMTVAGSEATLDYLGDGIHGFDPPLGDRLEGFGTHDLVTMRERWPVYLEPRACEVLGVTLPVSVEIAVPSSAGLLPLRGCCKWQD